MPRPPLPALLLLLLAAPAAAADPAGAPPRLPARAEKTDAEYKAWADELRAAYTKPAKEWPKPTLDPGTPWAELGPLPEPEHPKDNPFSKEKAELGKALFFDARLSGSGQIACASCHDPDLGWADGRTTAFGHGRKALKRNSPSILNVAFAPALFWDGRAKTLEDQAAAVLANPDEMRSDAKDVSARLSKVKGYPELFKAAFGDDGVTTERTAKAVACFERTVVGGKSRFDAFARGKADALSDPEVRGLHLFRTDARCGHCHNGPALTDGRFHDLGLSNYGTEFEDVGRYAVTKDVKDVGKFRTPSLRNVSKTAPHMHSGLFDIPTALILYNAGMRTLRPGARFKDDPKFPATKSPLLKPLGLNKHDLADLEAFLRSLEEPSRKFRPPAISQPAE